MKILPPASSQGRSKVDEHVAEVLEMLVSKERYFGVVEGRDRVGTTIFIKSGEFVFLAFVDLKNQLKPGDQVTFRIDGLRAKDIRKEILPTIPEPELPVAVLAELPEVIEQETEDDSELTTMAVAFKRLIK